MIRNNMIWYDMIWYAIIWYDIIWYDVIGYAVIWYDIIWYNIIWCAIIWLLMISHSNIWLNMSRWQFEWYTQCEWYILYLLWLKQFWWSRCKQQIIIHDEMKYVTLQHDRAE